MRRLGRRNPVQSHLSSFPVDVPGHDDMNAVSQTKNRKGSPAKYEAALNLFDPRRGDQAFKLERIDDASQFALPQRCNYFTILWIEKGTGTFHLDLAAHRFAGPAILFFNPYQTFFLAQKLPICGLSLQFHANFFCIETYHEAIGCNGVLFNDVYGPSQVPVGDSVASDFRNLAAMTEREFRTGGLAHTEALVSLLKLFLINATRLKLDQRQITHSPGASSKPSVLERLTELIEQHFRTRHGPAEYASALHITPKALGKLAKAHFGRTTTELIRDRLVKESKWQLLHTRRPVKEIAKGIGFDDELYFSRLFKRATGFSPTAFREFETAIRGGSNLSM